MKFVFNLERLMGLREKFEQLAKEELQKKIKERIQIEEEIEKINNKILKFQNDFNNLLKQSITSDKIQHLMKYREHLNIERKKLVILYQIKLKEEQIAREEYLQAKKEKDILDKLKERRKEDFFQELKSSENKEMDEIAQKIYFRKSNEEKK